MIEIIPERKEIKFKALVAPVKEKVAQIFAHYELVNIFHQGMRKSF